ncbi:MAG: DNA primase DnaG [Candidatus Aenigmarchaeota archaeon]|nr:DNA primase DnaG [Candidatus Aenigmarchaeota archaeon]
MAKLAPTSTKYVVKAYIKAKGIIEKPDVIGAIFGQTEGLLGSDLDLRELQRTGRIGRIEVNIKSHQGNSEGEIIIPSSLDSAETALRAATHETIERIGPCVAAIELRGVEDMRSEKRKYVIEKAKEILKNLVEAGVPSTAEISEQIKEAVRTHEISNYKGLPCGPNVIDSDNIIIVEGRADVINLLKFGIRNAVAIEGTSVPPVIIDISKEKIVTLFVDGDRGGQLISKEILQLTDVDFVATAPPGKEVEELTKKEVYKALREKISAEQFRMEYKIPDENGRKPFERRGFETEKREERREPAPAFEHPPAEQFESRPSLPRREYREREPREPRPRAELKPDQKELFSKTLEELVGTRAACIFNSDNSILGKVPVSELMDTLKTVENPHAIVFDGRVDFRLNSIAKRKGVKILVGMEKDRFVSSITILSRKDLEGAGPAKVEEKKA